MTNMLLLASSVSLSKYGIMLSLLTSDLLLIISVTDKLPLAIHVSVSLMSMIGILSLVTLLFISIKYIIVRTPVVS